MFFLKLKVVINREVKLLIKEQNIKMKLIFISGPSGSGKTTLSNKLIKKNKNGFVLSTDNYYKTGLISKLLSKFVEGYFDRMISFDYKQLKKDLCDTNQIETFETKNQLRALVDKYKDSVIRNEKLFAQQKALEDLSGSYELIIDSLNDV